MKATLWRPFGPWVIGIIPLFDTSSIFCTLLFALLTPIAAPVALHGNAVNPPLFGRVCRVAVRRAKLLAESDASVW